MTTLEPSSATRLNASTAGLTSTRGTKIDVDATAPLSKKIEHDNPVISADAFFFYMPHMYGNSCERSPSAATASKIPFIVFGTAAGPNGYAPHGSPFAGLGRFRFWALNDDEALRLKAIVENNAAAVADLRTATDLLERYLKHDRIAGIVRRPMPSRSETTLLDLLLKGKTDELLETCQDMFQFDDAHS